MRVIEISEDQSDLWNRAAASFDTAHPFNGYGWGNVRQVDGWRPSYYIARGESENEIRGLLLVLTKSAPILPFSVMYAPRGPLCDPNDHDTLRQLMNHAKQVAKQRRSIFLRVDPNIHQEHYTLGNDIFVNEGFTHLEQRWSFWNAPRDVYRIDMDKADTSDALFETISRDAQKCVLKAEKRGVTVRHAESLEDLQSFYELFSEFTVRKGFMCRQQKYYEALWNDFVAKGNGRLFLAMFEGKVIGGNIVLVLGRYCAGMHIGTLPQYNKLQTTYACIWESLRWAKERGCRWYSFRGVGSTASQERFKKKWGPQEVALVGYYDLPFRHLLYKLFFLGEFVVLPKLWRTLMKLRRIYKGKR